MFQLELFFYERSKSNTNEKSYKERWNQNKNKDLKLIYMKNIVILGHGVGVKFVVESLIKSNSNFRVVALVTHPKKEHEHDLNLMNKRKELFGEFAYNVFNVESDYNVKVLESKNVNHLETINWIKTFSPTYIVSISCRDILKSKFLNEFKNMVLNIHTTPLPQYRGAANDSWMILNNELGKKKYGCLHFIDEGIDTGPIIQKSFYNLPKDWISNRHF